MAGKLDCARLLRYRNARMIAIFRNAIWWGWFAAAFLVAIAVFSFVVWNSELRVRELSNCDAELGRCLEGVRTKKQLEEIVEAEIRASLGRDGRVDWSALKEKFENASDRCTVTIVGDDAKSPEGVAFRVDNRSPLSVFVGFPGASNGEFVAGVDLRVPGRIGIVQRGGERKWLKSE